MGRPDAPGLPIVAVGTACAAFDDVAALRKAPGPPGGPKVPFSLLKHADEQTVLGLSAVLHALAGSGLADRSLEDWGVIAAPRFLGRVAGTLHIDRYRRQGVPTVSPLIIPHLSLHSMSGTISLALGARGTNFGAGGADGHLAEGLLAAWCARHDGVPGLWLVATAWDREPAVDLERRTSAVPCVGHAAAFALMAEPVAGVRPIGHLRPVAAGESSGQGADLLDLCRFLDDARTATKPRRWYATIPGGALELGLDPSAAVAVAKAG